MKLSKNYAVFYKLIYGELPKDVCTFFWGSLFALALSPLLLPGRLWMRGFEKILGAGILTWAPYFLFMMLGFHSYAKYLGIDKLESYTVLNLEAWQIFLLMPLAGLGAVLAIAATCFLVVGIPYGIYWLLSLGVSSAGGAVKETTFAQNTRDFVGAVRGKYCTRINWK